MTGKWQDRRASLSIGEYILTFALVITVGVAMSVYVQRSLQARMRDARHYAITNLREQCRDTNCVGQGAIGDQYEPYYTQVSANTSLESVNQKGLKASGIGS